MDYLNRIKSEAEDVLLTSLDLSIAALESKLSRSGLLPKLDAEVRAGYLPLETRPKEGGASVAALAIMKIELFSGFETLWESREKEAKKLELIEKTNPEWKDLYPELI